jgi:pimeloyl-ACP methyl ester carboxylesterase
MLATTMERHGGRALRVARLGAGPPLVLLHGYPDNLQIFGALAPLLAATHQVIAFDWPGLGQSEAWPGGATPQDQADRLFALLEAWAIPRATIVGMDMGAQPALALALSDPARIERLVVMNALLFPDEPVSWEIRLLRRRRLNEHVLRAWPRLVFERAVRTSLPAGVRLPAGIRADLWTAFRQPQAREFTSRLCADYERALPSLAAGYARIRCPMLALWAERDAHFPLAHGQALRAAIPGAQLQVLPRATHWMAWDRAPEVARAIVDMMPS